MLQIDTESMIATLKRGAMSDEALWANAAILDAAIAKSPMPYGKYADYYSAHRALLRAMYLAIQQEVMERGLRARGGCCNEA